MPIPASYIVAITPRLISAGGTDLEFNGLVLTNSPLVPVGTELSFTSAGGVKSFFGVDSAEAELADVYFLGYNNSFTKPRRMMFGARVKTARAAWLQGGKYTGTLAAIKAVTNGGMNITINGTVCNLTGLNFSAATSYSAAAQTLQTALAAKVTGTTVAFSSVTNAFTITAPNPGTTSTITFASAPAAGTDVSALFGFTAGTGAAISRGSDALSPQGAMAAIKQSTQNFVTFTTAYLADDDEILGLAEWANDEGVDYLYVPWSLDAQLTAQGATDTIAHKLANAEYGATALVYGSSDVATFVCGMIASIDWNRRQGAINTAFKMQSGICPLIFDDTSAAVLDERRVNYVGKWATRNDDFTFLYKGQMFGDYRWIDTYINMVWLKNVMQVAIMNGLTSVGRVPYNERGYAYIRSWLQDPLNRAVRNGVIDNGVELSEAQKAQIIVEAGEDITNELWVNGYFVQVEDAGAQVRVNRDSPSVSVWYTYGGSIDKVDVAVTVAV